VISDRNADGALRDFYRGLPRVCHSPITSHLSPLTIAATLGSWARRPPPLFELRRARQADKAAP